MGCPDIYFDVTVDGNSGDVRECRWVGYEEGKKVSNEDFAWRYAPWDEQVKARVEGGVYKELEIADGQPAYTYATKPEESDPDYKKIFPAKCGPTFNYRANGLARNPYECHQAFAAAQPHASSQHYTMIFNTFVLMTLMNELNCRKLRHEWNVLDIRCKKDGGCECGFLNNITYVVIVVISFAVQIAVVQVPGLNEFFGAEQLDGRQWGVCLAFACGTFPVQWLICLFSRLHLGIGVCDSIKSVDKLVGEPTLANVEDPSKQKPVANPADVEKNKKATGLGVTNKKLAMRALGDTSGSLSDLRTLYPEHLDKVRKQSLGENRVVAGGAAGNNLRVPTDVPEGKAREPPAGAEGAFKASADANEDHKDAEEHV